MDEDGGFIEASEPHLIFRVTLFVPSSPQDIEFCGLGLGRLFTISHRFVYFMPSSFSVQNFASCCSGFIAFILHFAFKHHPMCIHKRVCPRERKIHY